MLASNSSPTSIQMIPVNKILPNPEQPRKHFDKIELAELAQSIKENGLIQAIIVEGPVENNYYIIDGERRLRATKLNGCKEIRCEVRTANLDHKLAENKLVDAMIANLQRSDLKPCEEADAYQKLKRLGYSDVGISLKIGISSARVADRLRLLELEPDIRNLIDADKLSKDKRLVAALLEITDSPVRVKVAKSLADRNAGIKAGVEACQRVQAHLNSEKISKSEIPATRFAQIKSGPLNRPIYDAQAALGRVPPWPLVEICARETCDACGLREVASSTTCKGCAMVEMLQRMIGGIKQ